jgi:hypothetical protein
MPFRFRNPRYLDSAATTGGDAPFSRVPADCTAIALRMTAVGLVHARLEPAISALVVGLVRPVPVIRLPVGGAGKPNDSRQRFSLGRRNVRTDARSFPVSLSDRIHGTRER